MRELTLNYAGSFRVGQKPGVQEVVSRQSFPFLKRLYSGLAGLKTGLHATFASEWEKKTGLPWREGW